MAHNFVKQKDYISCSYCGHLLGEDRLDSLLPGTTFALAMDGFKYNRAFCNKKEFGYFYLEHPEEEPRTNEYDDLADGSPFYDDFSNSYSNKSSKFYVLAVRDKR